jgi:hypothetical protein
MMEGAGLLTPRHLDMLTLRANRTIPPAPPIKYRPGRQPEGNKRCLANPVREVFNQDEWNSHSPMNKSIENLAALQTLELAGKPRPVAARQIAELRTQIPAPILAHFDRLLARGKKGVATIKGQVCAECHVQVPRNTVLTLMHGEDIQICENCGRYLRLPEPVNPTVPPAKAKKSRAASPP